MDRVMANAPVAVGVAGAGRIAERVHLPVLARLAGVRVVAIAEPAPARAAAAARRFPRARVLADVEALLALGEVEALVVCTPPDSHADTTRAALAAGVHVYVEKPVALTSREARDLVRMAETGRSIAMTGFNYRRHPLVERMRRHLQDGRIGQAVMVRSVFSVAHPATGWQASPATGGGALLELGSHHFDLARFLLDDELTDISARVWRRHNEGDTASVEFRMAAGVEGSIFMAVGAADADRFEVHGEAGVLRLDRLRADLSLEPPVFAYGRRRALARESLVLRHSLGRVLRSGGEPSYERALAAFVDAVRTGEGVHPDLRDGQRSLEWVEAALVSAASGTRVRVPAP
jgi:predicted dehydrogenase